MVSYFDARTPVDHQAVTSCSQVITLRSTRDQRTNPSAANAVRVCPRVYRAPAIQSGPTRVQCDAQTGRKQDANVVQAPCKRLANVAPRRTRSEKGAVPSINSTKHHVGLSDLTCRAGTDRRASPELRDEQFSIRPEGSGGRGSHRRRGTGQCEGGRTRRSALDDSSARARPWPSPNLCGRVATAGGGTGEPAFPNRPRTSCRRARRCSAATAKPRSQWP